MEHKPETGQAGVEVTPEMIEAGVKVLDDSGRLISDARGGDRILIEEIFRAMQARLSRAR